MLYNLNSWWSGLVIKTQCFPCWGWGLIPGRKGNPASHVVQPKNKLKKIMFYNFPHDPFPFDSQAFRYLVHLAPNIWKFSSYFLVIDYTLILLYDWRT